MRLKIYPFFIYRMGKIQKVQHQTVGEGVWKQTLSSIAPRRGVNWWGLCGIIWWTIWWIIHSSNLAFSLYIHYDHYLGYIAFEIFPLNQMTSIYCTAYHMIVIQVVGVCVRAKQSRQGDNPPVFRSDSTSLSFSLLISDK